MDTLSAFIARSFHEEDEKRMARLLQYLSSFESLGFFTRSAEPAEVESVSKKVQDLIDQCPVFIGILTRRYPILRSPLPRLMMFPRTTVEKTAWTAPPWVLQELGYAVRGKKSCVLFIEPEVERPGLIGDLEYIEYPHSNPDSALQRANQMINKLIAQHLRITPETTLNQSVEPSHAQEETESSVKEAAILDEGGGNAVDPFASIQDAIRRRDFTGARVHFEEGLSSLEKEKKPDSEIVLWKARYFWELADMGRPEGLQGLQKLVEQYPKEPFPRFGLGYCLDSSREYQQASEAFLQTAALQPWPGKANSMKWAASSLAKADKLTDAIGILRGAVGEAPDSESRLVLLNELHRLLREQKEVPWALGTGELSLHINPAQASQRFDLGRWYEDMGFYDFGLFHFGILCQQEEGSGSLHNLALAYSQLGLPILSATHYKLAFEKGGTLAASNLAHQYLGCGMADEAKKLLAEAMARPDPRPEVPHAMALVEERREEEGKKAAEIVERVSKYRNFLTALGQGYLDDQMPDLSGQWKFSFGVMNLSLGESSVIGTAEFTSEGSENLLLSSLMSGKRNYVDHYQFEVELGGRSGKFELTRTRKPKEGISPIPDTSTKKGYIVFAADGRSAELAELDDKEFAKHYSIFRQA